MKYLSIFFICIFFVSCSSRVQTNPIPEDIKYTLPNETNNVLNVENQEEIKDYDAYARGFFNKSLKDEEEDIFDIAIRNGYYDEKD